MWQRGRRRGNWKDRFTLGFSKVAAQRTVSDQAIHLDLVAKARGIPAAENYFIELSETSKNIPTYVLTNSKDVPGAEKCFREWESSCLTYDIRVVTVLMGAYAQELKEKDYNATSTGRGNGEKCVPSPEIIGTLMDHFEDEKDVDGAESILEILKKTVEDVGDEVFESLIRTYAAAGRTSPVLR
ncbi:hypothetical protein SLEP1_g25413 [Rubroshorea leprosula]|uniref:Uncharacterized protein n=1 Tax=Rubroshorea leprosula TaxID=152421 RepID=A0AAV5JTA8_9ROSI|nr:hypothetical protein SLEP1_g25413 [Rubroshorea leprosula]